MKKHIIIFEIFLFVIVTVLSTIHAARVDSGSRVLTYPYSENSDHFMTLREAVLHNLPSCIVEGLLAVALVAFIIYAVKTGREMWRIYREEKSSQ